MKQKYAVFQISLHGRPEMLPPIVWYGKIAIYTEHDSEEDALEAVTELMACDRTRNNNFRYTVLPVYYP